MNSMKPRWKLMQNLPIEYWKNWICEFLFAKSIISLYTLPISAAVAQLVEQGFCKPQVGSSSLSCGTISHKNNPSLAISYLSPNLGFYWLLLLFLRWIDIRMTFTPPLLHVSKREIVVNFFNFDIQATPKHHKPINRSCHETKSGWLNDFGRTRKNYNNSQTIRTAIESAPYLHHDFSRERVRMYFGRPHWC